VKRHNNPNYLASIDPRHPKLSIGQFSARSKRKNARNRLPIETAKNIFKFSDGQEYMRMPDGQLVRVTQVENPEKNAI